MKGDISCHVGNKKFRKGHDEINWGSETIDALVENAGSFVLEKDFCTGGKNKVVDMDKNNFQIP